MRSEFTATDAQDRADAIAGSKEAEITKGINDLVFSVVTCKAVNLNLDKVGEASKIVKIIQSVKNFVKEHEKGLKILNTTMDVVSACYEGYQQTGNLSLTNVVVNISTGSLKRFDMSNLRIGCQNDTVCPPPAEKIKGF